MLERAEERPVRLVSTDILACEVCDFFLVHAEKSVEARSFDFYSYTARHTYTNEALCKGVGILEVAELLGRKDTKMIQAHYAHLDHSVFHVISPDADGVRRSAVFPGLWLDGAALLVGDTMRVLTVLTQGLNAPEHAAFVARLAKGRS